MTNPYVADRDLVGKLEALLENSTSLLLLGYELKEQVREAMALIELPADGTALRQAALRYMAGVSNAQLRRDLIEARGKRSASCYATKMRGDLKARSNGHAHANGAGAAHAA